MLLLSTDYLTTMSLDSIETGSFLSREHDTAACPTIHIVSWNIDRGSCLREIIDFL